ncbi:MAG: endonuclease domain-containing protein, partial [Chloroflexota bacterium]
KLSGYKFLRQHPIIYKGDLTGLNYFIADFYCHEKRAVIELDGKIHDQTAEYDQFRDDQMKMMQIKVLRIKNEEVSDMKAVLKKILSFLESVQETQTRN